MSVSMTPPDTVDRPPGVIDVYGSLLRLDPGDSLYLGSHAYEPYLTKLFMGLVRPDDVVVDVGAMIGYYTVISARLVGSRGRVYALEPDPDNFSILESNVRMNGYGQVVLRCAAASNHVGTARLYKNESNRGDHRVFDSGDGRPSVDIASTSLDEFVEGPANLVKVDTQGSERLVLDGMRGLVDRSAHLILLIEFCPYLLLLAGSDPDGFLDELKRMRFTIYEVNEDAAEVRRCDTDELLERVRPEFGDSRAGYTNLLCTRP